MFISLVGQELIVQYVKCREHDLSSDWCPVDIEVSRCPGRNVVQSGVSGGETCVNGQS